MLPGIKCIETVPDSVPIFFPNICTIRIINNWRWSRTKSKDWHIKSSISDLNAIWTLGRTFIRRLEGTVSIRLLWCEGHSWRIFRLQWDETIIQQIYARIQLSYHTKWVGRPVHHIEIIIAIFHRCEHFDQSLQCQIQWDLGKPHQYTISRVSTFDGYMDTLLTQPFAIRDHRIDGMKLYNIRYGS